jgi:hypothetical protein
MGLEEDRVGLTGTELEKLLYRLQENEGGYVVRGPDGKWTMGDKPAPGAGEYYEALPGGEIRRWFNRGDDRYERIREGRKPGRR